MISKIPIWAQDDVNIPHFSTQIQPKNKKFCQKEPNNMKRNRKPGQISNEGNIPVWRRHSPTTITADNATLIERAFLFIGINSRASAF